MSPPPRRRRDVSSSDTTAPATATAAAAAATTAGLDTRTTPATDRTPITHTNAPDYMSIQPSSTRPQREQDLTDSNGDASGAHEAHGRWHAMWEKYGSVELENKGSVARDHLALERTFLAWLRTSLSFASIGIAITQLFRLNSTLSSRTSPSSSGSSNDATDTTTHLRHLGKPLGATFIGVAILTLGIGFHRYFEAQHYVIRGKFPAARGSILLLTGVAGILVVCSLGIIVAVAGGR